MVRAALMQLLDGVLACRHADRDGRVGTRRGNVQRSITDHEHAARVQRVTVDHAGALDRPPRQLGSVT